MCYRQRRIIGLDFESCTYLHYGPLEKEYPPMNLTIIKTRSCRLRHLGILWMLLAMPLAASTVRIYIPNHAGTTIQIVDPTSNKVVDEIKDIENPEAVSFSPDGSRVYITQGSENVLNVFDRKAN
jgi:DNA-binding beta-propeller fold protein YncE